MNWRKGDDYHIKSDPPGYTITRLFVNGGERFEVWRGPMHVSSHDTAEEARASADRHAERWAAGAPA